MLPYKTQIDAKHNAIISALFIYIGGFTLLLAVDTYCIMNWVDLNSFCKLSLTLGTGIITYVAALFLLNQHRFYHFGVMLYLVSTVQLISGLYVLFYILGFLDIDNYYLALSPDGVYISKLTMNTIAILSIITLQQALTYFYLKPVEPIAAVLLLSTLFLIGNVLSYFGVAMEYAWIIMGILYLCTVYFFADTIFKKSSPLWYFLGAVNLFAGFYLLFNHLGVAALFYLIIAAVLYIGLVKNTLTLLYVAVFTAVVFTFDLTGPYFIAAIGWPLTLLLYSIAFMLVSLIISNFGSIKSIFIKNRDYM